MNFLAHLLLADRTGTSLAGSVLGDVVRGADLVEYPADIALGIRLHRRVDATTDRHPAIVAQRAQFAEGTRRYAGILLDLACDYVLLQHWPAHSDEPVGHFTARAARDVAAAGIWFERNGARAPTAPGFAQLLLSYGEEAGIERAIARTAQRLKQPEKLLQAAGSWRDSTDALAAMLPTLLRDLASEMEAYKLSAGAPDPGAANS